MAYSRRYYNDVHTPEFEPKISIKICDSSETKTKIIAKPEFQKVLDQWHK